MSVQSINLALRGWFSDGRIVRKEDFLLPLGVEPVSPVISIHESDRQWAATLVYFLDITKKGFGQEGGRDGEAEIEAIETFFQDIDREFIGFAAWLSERDSSIFDELRERGIIFDVFIGAWLEDSQFDLSLPPALLLECGKRGLKIEVCTND